MFHYEPPNYKPKTNKVAAFDIDWTLTYSEQQLFSMIECDIHLLPNRYDRLMNLHKKGFSIALFTNQKSRNKQEEDKKIARIMTIIHLLHGIPVYIFIATCDDKYRKPNIGMWENFIELVAIKSVKAFFVGDAMGRPQDFSDSDKQFAVNIGIPYYTPEEFFGESKISIPRYGKNMIVIVGMPGSGKSSFSREELVPRGYTHISKDELKTEAKVIKMVKQNIKNGNSFVIDATNNRQSKRQKYYDLALISDYNITVLYFVRNGTGWNKLREGKEKVPMIAFHVYYKYLDPPTEENTPGNVILVD